MSARHCSLVILGSGPAGEGAAMKLAKAGRKVAIVDVRDQLGGNCAHVGTIPSKALRQTVSSIIRYQRDPMFQKVGEWKQFTMKQVLRNAHKVIQQQVDTHTRFYDRNKIDVFHGRAYIQDKNTVLIFAKISGSFSCTHLNFDAVKLPGEFNK